jgi:hypothetical protein
MSIPGVFEPRANFGYNLGAAQYGKGALQTTPGVKNGKNGTSLITKWSPANAPNATHATPHDACPQCGDCPPCPGTDCPVCGSGSVDLGPAPRSPWWYAAGGVLAGGLVAWAVARR